MRNAFAFSRENHVQMEATPDFHVVLVYQDFDSGTRAKEFFDRLVHDHEGRFRFLCHLWKFDLLQAPELKDQAMLEAVDADMLVIAALGKPELPRAVRDWIERWLRRTTLSGALVALLAGAETGKGPVYSYLSQLAAKGRMMFFAREVPSPKAELSLPVETLQQQAGTTSLGLRGDLPQTIASSHWGINE
jgi:hypothetical protein